VSDEPPESRPFDELELGFEDLRQEPPVAESSAGDPPRPKGAPRDARRGPFSHRAATALTDNDQLSVKN
jgi:hypothetical protein